LLAALDLIAMPLCAPVVVLRAPWVIGEAVGVLMIVLAPALCFARWTITNAHVRVRAILQAAIAGMVFLYLVPEMIFAVRPGRGWTPLLEMPAWTRQLAIQMLILFALPGLGAAMEFAERGQGTPIPYDPPARLVVSGVYRYCANPMQVSCALVMLAWAALLRNGWLFVAAAASIAYSAGIARWDEALDMEKRFGAEWRQYRNEVRNWGLRWRPYHSGPVARVYIAATCGPCSELRAWLEKRNPEGMAIVDAETVAPGSIRRMRYDPGDGSGVEEGVRALGRSLEHLNPGWALAGTALRLPLVWRGVQLVMDASGLGPREICQARRVN
jgi:protein-S-isoprenylcysteine O-methyltransferase Ste14